MKPGFKELHRIIVELSPEETNFISTKLNKAELEKIRLLSGKKTITELNSLQNSDHTKSYKWRYKKCKWWYRTTIQKDRITSNRFT